MNDAFQTVMSFLQLVWYESPTPVQVAQAVFAGGALAWGGFNILAKGVQIARTVCSYVERFLHQPSALFAEMRRLLEQADNWTTGDDQTIEWAGTHNPHRSFWVEFNAAGPAAFVFDTVPVDSRLRRWERRALSRLAVQRLDGILTNPATTKKAA